MGIQVRHFSDRTYLIIEKDRKTIKNLTGLFANAYNTIASLKLELPSLDKHKQDMYVHLSSDNSVTFFYF
jgi:hypothetical protein